MSDLLGGVMADTWATGDAIISPDGKYRYRLRRGDINRPHVHWIMLNPSTADATINDATIRKCIGFSKKLGFRALTVHNLFAVRATDPRDMKAASDPVGPDNHTHIDRMIDTAITNREPIVCAWGIHGSYMEQNETTLGWLEAHYSRLLWCLGKTACGNPKHPLMPGYDTPFVRMDGKANGSR